MQGSPEIFHYLCILMKLLKRIFILCAVVIGLTACGASKIKDISLTSVGVSYVVPTSSRSMDAKLILGIDNPAMAFTVQEVAGTIRYQDKELAHFVTGPVSLEAKCEKQYKLPCTVSLAEGASLLDILVIASKRSLEGLKADVDVQAALKKNGALRAPFKFKDIDISQFTSK